MKDIEDVLKRAKQYVNASEFCDSPYAAAIIDELVAAFAERDARIAELDEALQIAFGHISAACKAIEIAVTARKGKK